MVTFSPGSNAGIPKEKKEPVRISTKIRRKSPERKRNMRTYLNKDN